MTMARMDAMQVRLDVMSLALAALARAVPADLAAGIQEGLQREVAKRLDGVALSPQADECWRRRWNEPIQWAVPASR